MGQVLESSVADLRAELSFILASCHRLSDADLILFAKAAQALSAKIDAAEHRKRVKELQDSLEAFAIEAWEHVEDEPLDHNWHFSMVCEYVQACEEGDPFKDLIVNIPPGTGKSSIISVLYPAWAWSRNPKLKFFCASYSQQLSIRDTAKCRKLISSDWYQSHFGDTVQIGKTDTQAKFDTAAGGWRISTTPGGQGTGNHPDRILCFPAGTLVMTDKGNIPIERIAANPSGYLVMTHMCRYQKVNRVFVNKAKNLIHIADDTCVVKCTPNHPVWVEEKGWTRADAVIQGDHLRRLRGEVPREDTSEVLATTSHEIDCTVYNLDIGTDHTYWADGVLVHNCDDINSAAKAESARERGNVNDWWDLTMPTRGAGLDRRRIGVQQRFHMDDWTGHVLKREKGWGHLCLPMRFEANRMPTYPGLRQDPRTADGELLWPKRYPEPVLQSLERSMGIYGCTPQESPVLMADLSVKPIGKIVAGDKVCGFAKEKQAGESTVLEVYTYHAPVFKLTLSSGKVIRCTRDHKWFDSRNSKGGGLHYAPARVGSKLARVCPGQLPEMGQADECLASWLCETVTKIEYDYDETVYALKTTTGNYVVWGLASSNSSGQFQQRPTAREGAIFSIDRLNIIPRSQLPESAIKRTIRGWDKAGTKDAGCYTAGVLGGIVQLHDEPQQIYILDVARKQWSVNDVERQIDLHAKMDELRFGFDRYQTVFEMEPGASGIQAARETVRRLKGRRVRAVSPSGSKVARAEPLANAIDAYEVFLVEADWNYPFIEELQSFPKGEYADQVDAASLMYMELVRPTFAEPTDEDKEEHGKIWVNCGNLSCDRMMREGQERCCETCGTDDVHTGNCTMIHAQLYARQLWQPATRIVGESRKRTKER